VAAGLRSGTVILLDRTGRTLWTRESGCALHGISLSRNGKYLMTGTADGGIHLLNIRGEPIWERKARGPVPAVAVSSSANFAAAGSEDGSIYFLDNYSTNMGGKITWSLPTRGKVREVVISSDGFYTAASTSDSNVHFLDKLGKLYWSNRVDNTPASMAMSSSGDLVAVGIEGGAHPGAVSLFHRNEGLLWRYHTGDATVGALDMTANGAFLAAGSQNGEIYLFHREQKLLWKRPVDGWVDALALSSDGNYTVAGTRKGNVYLFDNRAAVGEFRPKTRDELELEVSLFRPMRTAPAAAPEGPAPAAARPEGASRTAMEIVVAICLLVVLGLLATVYILMVMGTIGQVMGVALLIFLLVVMVILIGVFYRFVLSRGGQSKNRSFY